MVTRPISLDGDITTKTLSNGIGVTVLNGGFPGESGEKIAKINGEVSQILSEIPLKPCGCPITCKGEKCEGKGNCGGHKKD